jgi:hypothetical protein
MFCPGCGSEYVEGVTECPDCRVALVNELPPDGGGPGPGGRGASPEQGVDPREDDVRYIPLLRTYSAKDIAFIHSVLGDTGIDYFIRGEGLTHLRPLADPAILMVDEKAAGDAGELLKDLPLSFYPWAPEGGRSPRDEGTPDRQDGGSGKG